MLEGEEEDCIICPGLSPGGQEFTAEPENSHKVKAAFKYKLVFFFKVKGAQVAEGNLSTSDKYVFCSNVQEINSVLMGKCILL